MRTQDEIVARFKERAATDWLGFEVNEYLSAMDFEHANEFLKDDVTPDQFKTTFKTDDDVRRCMAQYIDFAWNKCNNERGISASRSLMHYVAWIWLVGDDDVYDRLELEMEKNHNDYGRSCLELLCQHYGWSNEARDEAKMPPRNAELTGFAPPKSS